MSDPSVCRAKWSDVPFPFEVESRVQSSLDAMLTADARGCIFSFSTQSTLNEIKTFYVSELEREGWSQNRIFELEREVLMSYEKPSKMLIVKISGIVSRCDVRVYVSSKQRMSTEKGTITCP